MGDRVLELSANDLVGDRMLAPELSGLRSSISEVCRHRKPTMWKEESALDGEAEPSRIPRRSAILLYTYSTPQCLGTRRQGGCETKKRRENFDG